MLIGFLIEPLMTSLSEISAVVMKVPEPSVGMDRRFPHKSPFFRAFFLWVSFLLQIIFSRTLLWCHSRCVSVFPLGLHNSSFCWIFVIVRALLPRSIKIQHFFDMRTKKAALEDCFMGGYYWCISRNLYPLKWIIWSGASAIHTSDSQAISVENLRKIVLFSKAEIKTRLAVQSFSFALSLSTLISDICP